MPIDSFSDQQVQSKFASIVVSDLVDLGFYFRIVGLIQNLVLYRWVLDQDSIFLFLGSF